MVMFKLDGAMPEGGETDAQGTLEVEVQLRVPAPELMIWTG
jgi:hypothetical protein